MTRSRILNPCFRRTAAAAERISSRLTVSHTRLPAERFTDRKLLMDFVVHLHLLRALDCTTVKQANQCDGACRWDRSGDRCRSKYDPVFGATRYVELSNQADLTVEDEIVLNALGGPRSRP